MIRSWSHVQVSRLIDLGLTWDFRVEIPYKRDVDTEISVDRTAVDTEIHSEWNRTPRWIFGSAIKTYLEGMIRNGDFKSGSRRAVYYLVCSTPFLLELRK